MKTVFLFSGQGSQYPKMGAEIVELFPEKSREILDAANKILGYDIWELIQNGSAEELAQTNVSQPAIFTMSLLSLAAAREIKLEASAAAGHSLGEYAAMVAAEMLSVEDGYRAIKLRAEAMAKAAAENPGAMAAIIGLPADKIEEICAKICSEGEYVCAVNYNSPAQTVIAGTKDGIAKASEQLKAAGAKRALPLAVSAAFHSKLMKSASDEFRMGINGFTFRQPKIDFYSNLIGGKLEDFSNMKDILAKHICSPVKFVSELEALQAAGYDRFVELGPGKVLTGLVSKTLRDVSALNIEDRKSLENARI